VFPAGSQVEASGNAGDGIDEFSRLLDADYEESDAEVGNNANTANNAHARARARADEEGVHANVFNDDIAAQHVYKPEPDDDGDDDEDEDEDEDDDKRTPYDENYANFIFAAERNPFYRGDGVDILASDYVDSYRGGTTSDGEEGGSSSSSPGALEDGGQSYRCTYLLNRWLSLTIFFP
jgi:hypothetical protein